MVKHELAEPDPFIILVPCTDRSQPATITEMAGGQGRPSAEVRELFGVRANGEP
jgi:hypothetical protein